VYPCSLLPICVLSCFPSFILESMDLNPCYHNYCTFSKTGCVLISQAFFTICRPQRTRYLLCPCSPWLRPSSVMTDGRSVTEDGDVLHQRNGQGALHPQLYQWMQSGCIARSWDRYFFPWGIGKTRSVLDVTWLP
jgi:hypothetical protein